jgi:PAS domain S-box-containing protein
MEQSPLSTQVFSPDGRTIQVNRAWEQLWGATLQDVASYNVLEDPQLEARGILPYIRRGFAGEALAIPAIWYDPNETVREGSRRREPRRWVRAFIHPIKDTSGQITEVVLVHEDMTDQKLAEEALRDSEQRFNRFMQNLPGLAWSKDRQGRYVFANDSAATAFGTPREVLLGRTDDELFPPETAALFKANDRAALDHPSGLHVVERLTHPDGTVHHSLVAKFPIPNGDGAPALVGGIAIDITDLQRAQLELRGSESRLRLALDAGRMGVWEWNLQTNQVWWSDNLEPIHGLAPGSFGGSLADFQKLIHPDDRALVQAAIEDAIGRAGSYEVEFRIVWPDGSVHWIQGKGKVFCDGSGTPERMMGVGLDVTARRNAEDGLRAADQRKNEFLATLAHELRNPLAPLRNALQIMHLAEGDRRAVEQARAMMERQLVQMVHLVDDLLDVSRISLGKIELRKQRIDLAKVVQQALESCRPAIEQSELALKLTLTAEPVMVDADATRMAQVFANLLHNAAKYTPPRGAIQLTLTTDAASAIVTVRDNGIGIPEPMLPCVFDMFTQVDRHLERSQGGLGIGLSIVKRLVEMHGGTVEANSDGDGQGSEFVVCLPRSAAAVMGPTHSPQQPARNGSRRILVVDDNRDAAISLAMMLKLMGNETLAAHDGLEALELAASFRPELVLLDLGMPRLNGFDTARQLRAQPWGENVLLVALTGWGQEEDRRKSQEAGFDMHIVKPIAPAALEKLLATCAAVGGLSLRQPLK